MPGPDPTPFPLDWLPLEGEVDAPALIVGDETLTYGDLDTAVWRACLQLEALGLKKGDRFASWMGKTRLACILPLAAARAALIHVPINPILKRAQAAHILADSGARLLLEVSPDGSTGIDRLELVGPRARDDVAVYGTPFVIRAGG